MPARVWEMNHPPQFWIWEGVGRGGDAAAIPLLVPGAEIAPLYILNIVTLVAYYKMMEYNTLKYITDLPIIGIGVEV